MSIIRSIDFTTRLPFLALVRKDMLQRLRGGRLFFWMGLSVALGMQLVLSRWPSEGFYLREGTSASRDILYALYLVWFWCAGLLVPAYAAASIVGERERGTYEMTSMTLIRPRGYVMAKMIGSLGPLLFTVVATMPLAGTMFFLAGVNWEILLYGLAAAASGGWICSGAGVLCSVICRRTGRAVAAAYVLAPGTLIGLAVGAGIYTGLLVAVDSLVPFSVALALPGGLLIMMLVFPIVIVRQTVRILKNRSVADEAWEREQVYLRTLARKESSVRESVPDGVNPHALAEEWRPSSSPPGEFEFGIGLFFLLGSALVVLSAFSIGGLSSAVRAWMVFGFVPAMSIPGLLMCRVVSGEIEQGSLDSLRATLLGSWDLVTGKIRGFLRSWRWALGVFGGVAVLLLVGGFAECWSLPVTWLLSMASCVWVSGIVGLAVSVSTRRVSSSAAVATTVLLILGLVLPGLGRLVAWIVQVVVGVAEPGIRAGAGEAFGLLSPPLGFYFNLDRLRDGQYFTSYWIQNIAVCMTWSSALLWYSMRRLKRIWARGIE